MGTLLVVLVIVATSLAYPQHEWVSNGDVKQSTVSKDINHGRSIGNIQPDSFTTQDRLRQEEFLKFFLGDLSLNYRTNQKKTEPNESAGEPIKFCEKSECTNLATPIESAVCCLKPEPATPIGQQCRDHQECVEEKFCTPTRVQGIDERGPFDPITWPKTCYLSSGDKGLCCTPLPLPPHVEYCRDNSFCTSESSCLGKALNSNNEFVDYVKTGSWTGCSYGLETGICCLKRENAASNLKPATECGIRNYNINETMTTSKYGPDEAAFGEFPWQAILAYRNYSTFCAATLVSQKHVVTAAQCVYKMHPRDIIVRLGQWHIDTNQALPFVDIGVFKMFMHTPFDPNSIRNDIAVLELNQPIQYQYNINSVCLQQSNVIQPNSKCFATGHSFEGHLFILKKFELSYVDQEPCQNRLRKTPTLGKYFLLEKSSVCAEGEENKNACFMDIGGPLVCKDELTSRYILIGVNSWGIGCNTKGFPEVYTNVPLFYDFLNDLINGNFQSYNPDYFD